VRVSPASVWPAKRRVAGKAKRAADGSRAAPFGKNQLMRHRRVLTFRFASFHRAGDLNLNLEPLAPLFPRGNDTPGTQLLGEGKWHETFGFTPT